MPRRGEGYHLTPFLLTRPEWFDRAACRDASVSEFFPGNGQSAARAIAKFCAHCPVVNECAQFAKDTHTHHGVWGGRIRGRP